MRDHRARAAALLVVGTAMAASLVGGAAPAAAKIKLPKRPPPPCETFKIAWADHVLGVDANTVLSEKNHTENKGKAREIRTCKITAGATELDVSTSYALNSITGPFKYYKHRDLGHGGEVGVSTTKSFPETVATYERDDVYFIDTLDKTLQNKGAKLYKFALKQSNLWDKAIKAK
jgi:hypothetical protein